MPESMMAELATAPSDSDCRAAFKDSIDMEGADPTSRELVDVRKPVMLKVLRTVDPQIPLLSG